MAWQIELTETVRKSLSKMDRPVALRIAVFLRQRVAALDDPRSIGQALVGSNLGTFWKYRVGDYRLVCDLQDGVFKVLVVEIGHRSEVYRT